MIKPKEIFTFKDPYIAAASGLVVSQDRFYLVADDELSVLGMDLNLKRPGEVYPVFPGELPEDKKERKKLKPDFECLVYLEESHSLLCIPSGSKKNRHKGALINLTDHVITELSFKEVYKELEDLYPELNLEGAIIIGEDIRLFQRGNGKLHQNAIIDMNLRNFLKDKTKDLKTSDIDLGKLKNIALSFTDATLVNGKIYFTAVAENSESTYADGEFVGAVLGEMEINGELIKMTPLDISSKPEGLAYTKKTFFVVTDDDDRKKPSRLFSFTID